MAVSRKLALWVKPPYHRPSMTFLLRHQYTQHTFPCPTVTLAVALRRAVGNRLNKNRSISYFCISFAQGEFQGLHFNQDHYETMGHSLCEAMLELVDPDQSNVESIVRYLVEK